MGLVIIVVLFMLLFALLSFIFQTKTIINPNFFRGLTIACAVIALLFGLGFKSDQADYRETQEILRNRSYILDKLNEGVGAAEKGALRILEDMDNEKVLEAKLGRVNWFLADFYGKRMANLPISEIVLRWDEQHK